MKRTAGLIAALAVPLLALSACATPDAEPPATPDASGELRAQNVSMRTVAPSDAEALDAVVAATGALGLIALDSATHEGNVVVSPASLATALAMLVEGAKGQTLSDLEAALGATGEDRRDAFAALQRSVREFEGDPAEAVGDELPERPILHLANNLVVNEGFEVRQSYLDALADGFDAGMQSTDLSSDAGKKVLDAWVNEHTGGLIEESAIQPDPDLELVLQNAILFAAKWQTPFDGNRTMDLPFVLSDGSSVEVETMTMSPGEFAYAELDGGWVAVRLPYSEGAHADLLLPPAGTDPAAATPELLAQATETLDAARPIRLALSLPTLDIPVDEPLDLIGSGIFERAGLGSTFCGNPGVDLSGISDVPLCVGQAFQQAVLRVDEEGTVAAAVTELGLMPTSLPMVDETVAFDRPFLFTIVHDETGWLLFQAAIRDPRH